MILAYETGSALQLMSYADGSMNDLYLDPTGEALFSFANADLQPLTQKIADYFKSRIDMESMKCLRNQDDSLLEDIRASLRRVHPFFASSDHESALPDLLANTLNALLTGKELTEKKYSSLLSHLTEHSLQLCVSDNGYFDSYHDELLFRKKNYQDFLRGKSNRQCDFTSLSKLQKYVRTYLYWVLDASSHRFSNLNMETRLKVYSQTFGSFNTWQPLFIKEVSCVGQFEDHSSLEAIISRSIRKLQNGEPPTINVELSSEKERRDYADAFIVMDSDDIDIDADLQGRLKKNISSASGSEAAPLFKAYEIAKFSDYILLQLRLWTEKATIIRRCKNCGQYFITERSNIDYCQRILPGETQTCYVIGPKRVFNKLLSADVPRNLYSKAYKKYQARLRRNGITADEFEEWKVQAKQYLEDVQNGKISLEDYSVWMEQ